jgi:hypothetical protein
MNLADIYKNFPLKTRVRYKDDNLIEILEERKSNGLGFEYYTSYEKYPNSGILKVADLNNWEVVEDKKCTI